MTKLCTGVQMQGLGADLGQGNHGAIVEHRQQHDENGGEVEVVDGRQQAESEADTERHGHCVPVKHDTR